MPALLERGDLDRLIRLLSQRGVTVLGPVIRDAAIVYDAITSIDDLPEGYADDQRAGRYRLARRDDALLFGYACGPDSWKRYFYPPAITIWSARRSNDGRGIETDQRPDDPPACALLGVRSCELHALAIHDQVLLGGPFRDPDYQRRRRQAFVIAVHCTDPGGTCFCVSMDTGPRCRAGFDLALTEIALGESSRFVVETGSDRGAEILAQLAPRDARPDELESAEDAIRRAASTMGRALDTAQLEAKLAARHDHPRWEQAAARCLACGNCTLVCPTCFCATVDDATDLAGARAQRIRRWDSCFDDGFSYIHGGSVRRSIRSRYRQWLTHKLSTWVGQFGRSGCVGCGRCITWCPVGIDITEEAGALCAEPSPERPEAGPRGRSEHDRDP